MRRSLVNLLGLFDAVTLVVTGCLRTKKKTYFQYLNLTIVLICMTKWDSFYK